eukprot:TRINITY_DN7181_c0_g1_i2.p1 TRINITY_DN7181_c0_g1~~TRINITY_DN7181_c0_g1_i2.p1  ORF type:complete len:204 (-),score=41.68 TRINITY_DN7181_c0_g1_i2:196-729(-)
MARQSRRSALSRATLLVLATGAASFFSVGFVPSPGKSCSRRDLVAALPVVGAFATGSAALADLSQWAGSYDDPLHPYCKRKVIVANEVSKTLLINAADGASTKSCKGKEVKKWSAVARVTSDNEMVVDFSEKGGPADVLAKWDENGIVFPDGNKWTKLRGAPDKKAKGVVTDANTLR